MSDQPSRPAAATDRETKILGLSTAELAGVSVDELAGNKTAVTLVMHYYKQLSDENTSLRNDLNTLQTYVDGYMTARHDARTGAILSALSSRLFGAITR